ncbi:Golgi transport complex subunit 3 [Orbilia oligospora]|uniref:Conserved oligomeric Golgi complex subunit 3 n=1 Tax=Orbilia oligospora TaxID=2813651 RepID=A0A8H2E5F3_ORBOL|nr:Golgi transport complex subunit 3 [Orbilia oligospora]
MYEDHWYNAAAAEEVQQKTSKPLKSNPLTSRPEGEKLGKPRVAAKPVRKHDEPPKAEVPPRPSSAGGLKTASIDFTEVSSTIDGLKLDNELDFAIWYEKYEEELEDAADEQFRVFQTRLQSHLYTCDSLLSEARETVALLDDLAKGFEAVREQTSSFQAACEELLSEQSRLSKLADDITANLEPFSVLESITRRLNAPGSTIVTRPDFKDMLSKLDSCLDYVAAHPNFKDAEFYQSRYRQLMTRALTLIKVHFTAQLRDVAADVGKRIAAKGVNDTTQTALLYAKFRVGGNQLRELADEIEKRCGHEEYFSLLNECYNFYFSARQRLLFPIVTKSMRDMSSNKDLVGFARVSISYVRSICLDEYELFFNHFSSGEQQLYDYLESISEPLYDYLRPRIMHETQLVKLCELCSLLQSRYMRDSDEAELESYDRSQLDFGRLVQSPLHDAQARIIFRAQNVIRNDIENFIPKPEDLDYPERNKIIQTPLKSPRVGKILDPVSPMEGENPSQFDTDAVFQGWYPSLRKSIWLLSRIYRLVNSSVFDDLAHQVVHVCIGSLSRAADQIRRMKNDTDSQLFLLKHLLILKEQIVAFDIEYVRPEVEFDFSTFWEIRQTESLFSPNGLMKLVQKGLPKVVENMLDAKVELDMKLRNVINQFTEAWASKISGPVVESAGKGTEALEATISLRKLAESDVPILRQKLNEYINDIRTRETLVGAVQEMVIQSYESFYERADKLAPELEDLWDIDTFVVFTNKAFGTEDALGFPGGSNVSSRRGSIGSNPLSV